VEQVAIDAASQAAYFPRTLAKTLPLLSDGEAMGLAQYLIARYAQPIYRVDQVELDGLMDDLLWPQLLGREISDRIGVIQRPRVVSGGWALGAAHLGTETILGARAISSDCRIEAIGHQIASDTWRTILQLSPSGTDVWWKLEDATYGILDATTIAAY
jgi:hypothetical protein